MQNSPFSPRKREEERRERRGNFSTPTFSTLFDESCHLLPAPLRKDGRAEEGRVGTLELRREGREGGNIIESRRERKKSLLKCIDFQKSCPAISSEGGADRGGRVGIASRIKRKIENKGEGGVRRTKQTGGRGKKMCMFTFFKDCSLFCVGRTTHRDGVPAGGVSGSDGRDRSKARGRSKGGILCEGWGRLKRHCQCQEAQTLLITFFFPPKRAGLSFPPFSSSLFFPLSKQETTAETETTFSAFFAPFSERKGLSCAEKKGGKKGGREVDLEELDGARKALLRFTKFFGPSWILQPLSPSLLFCLLSSLRMRPGILFLLLL